MSIHKKGRAGTKKGRTVPQNIELKDHKYNIDESIIVVDEFECDVYRESGREKAKVSYYYSKEKEFFVSNKFKDGVQKLEPVDDKIEKHLQQLDLERLNILLKLKEKTKQC